MNTANHLSEDDLALFALQLLSDQETADALVHLEHCEACRQEIGRLQGDLAAYAMTSEMHSPPALARERLMRSVAKEKKIVPMERIPAAEAPEPVLPQRSTRIFEMEPPERRGRGAVAMAWIGWAVAAGMAVAAGLQFHQRQMLQSNLNSESAQLSQADSDAARAQQLMQTLTGAGAQQVALHLPAQGPAAPPTPEGHAVYVADTGSLVFVASHLDPLQQYKTYELWVIPDDKEQSPIPAGTFKPDASGNGNVILPVLPKGVPAKVFAVTIEDDGGSRQPTKPIVLAGM